MTWISTASGNKIDFLSPDPLSIDIEDIAAGLAAMPRWAGQTLYRGVPCHYSVAQHSWYVCDRFETPTLGLKALLHDAPEAYMGDCPRPLKDMLGLTWRRIENRLLAAIFERFGLDFDDDLPSTIKHVDDRLLMTERRDLQPSCPPWDSGPWPDPYEMRIEPWPYARAREQFLRRFYRLHLLLQSQGLPAMSRVPEGT